jgi:hypothetical protein
MFDVGSLPSSQFHHICPCLEPQTKISSLFIKSLDPTLHRQFAYHIIPTHRSFVSTVQSTILYCFIYIFYTIIIIVIYFGEKNQFLLVCLSEHYLFCRCLSIASSYIILHTYAMQYHRFGNVLTFDTDVVLERYLLRVRSKRWPKIQNRPRRIRRKVIALIDSGPSIILRPWSELTDDSVIRKRHDAAIS